MKSALLAALCLLAACGSAQDKTEGSRIAAGIGKKLVGRFTAPEAVPVPPQEMAAKALALSASPMLMAQFEGAARGDIAELVGQNGAMRSYTTASQKGIILRSGLLIGTRGFGNDMMSADVEPAAALILSRTAGQAARKLRYLDGEGVERPVPLDCAITPAAPVEQAEITLTPVGERCVFRNLVVENSYFVTPEGKILASRQWGGPRLGYLNLTVLRD